VVRGHINQASNIPTAEAVVLAMYLMMATIVFSPFITRLARHRQHQTNNAGQALAADYTALPLFLALLPLLLAVLYRMIL